MWNSLDALQAQVRYHQQDAMAQADRARLARAARRSRRGRSLTRRDVRRLHAEITAFVAGSAPADQRPFETMSAADRRR